MSLLPQRKKSSEEIARLRESLGIPGAPPDPETPPAPEPAATATLIHGHDPAGHGPRPLHTLKRSELDPADLTGETSVIIEQPAHLDPPAPQPAQIRSLKRSERIPAVPAGKPEPAHEAAPAPQKQVRSLRKSEQFPAPAIHSAPPDSQLPHHRHSDRELNEMRRREALALIQAPQKPPPAAAHPAIIAPGYILALAGASCFFFYEFPMEATAGCSAAALLIAAFIFLRRPFSRHHAAFIAMIALLVLVFGALHFFPQLRHAT